MNEKNIDNSFFKIIYKKVGISSFKAINEYKKNNNIKKIGHTGTLDPLAGGLLLIATNEYTKLIPYIKNKDKSYKVTLMLGYVSETYDSEGPIHFHSNNVPNEKEVFSIINSFIGNIEQTPPKYSSKKINGNRAYELARKKIDFSIKPSIVRVYEITNINYEYPFINFDTTVSNGTYIRSLVHDIGIKLNTGAYMTMLNRTMVNGLTINSKINENELLNISSIEINNEQLTLLFNGLDIKLDYIDGKYLIKFENEIVGILEIKNKKILWRKLFGKKIQNLLSTNRGE